MQAALSSPAGWRPLTVNPYSGAFGVGEETSLTEALAAEDGPLAQGHTLVRVRLITRVVARARPTGMRFWAAVEVTGPGGLSLLASDPSGEAFGTFEEAEEIAGFYREHLLANVGCLGKLCLGAFGGDDDVDTGAGVDRSAPGCNEDLGVLTLP